MSQAKREPSSENKLGTMNIWRLIVVMALPVAASMLVQALYNVVDGIYISRISDSAVTAISLAQPVQNLLIGFAVSIAVGVNALMSRSLGEKNRDEASRALGNGLFMGIVVSLGFLLFGFLGVGSFYRVQSDQLETIANGIRYSSICSIFSFGVLAEVLLERALQASGRSVYSMIAQCIGAGLNILLDPVLIFGWLGLPAMGIAGAAVATVLSQWIAALIALLFNLRFNTDISFGLRFLRPNRKTIRPILAVGVPSLIMTGIGSVVNFTLNQIFQGFSEVATGVVGIYYRLQGFFFMPIYGLNTAAISIIAYNYGAGKPDRMREATKDASLLAEGIALLGVVVFMAFPQWLLGFFAPSPEFLEIGTAALRITSLGFLFAPVSIMISAFFQAVGDGIHSSVVSLCRQVVGLLPVAYLLSLTGSVGNMWWAFLISEVFGLIVALILLRNKSRALLKIRQANQDLQS